jgi:hypothetical protein
VKLKKKTPDITNIIYLSYSKNCSYDNCKQHFDFATTLAWKRLPYEEAYYLEPQVPLRVPSFFQLFLYGALPPFANILQVCIHMDTDFALE